VKLSSENPGLVFRIIRSGKTEMYDTGLAHVRDGHEPDYLYGHKIDIDRWPQWVHDAASNIAFGSDPAPALNLHQPCQGKIATCEEPARLQLEHLLTMKDQLMVPGLQTLITTSKSGLGGLERSTKCDDFVNSAFPNANERPQCEISWKTYLAKAIPVFYKFGIDPTSQPDATAGKNCSAWRCTGNKTYDGELPGSCKFEIIDDLRFGLEPLP
jgi:hypothetical protein